jgi:lipopolysaccharide transport system permease protein
MPNTDQNTLPVDRRVLARNHVLVSSSSGASDHYLAECWRHRDIIRFLARRDLVIRYRRTLIGLGWVLLKPILAMLVFTVVFGRIAHLPSFGIPYPLLVLTGMMPWQFFASVVNEASISLANNPSLVTKVWLPRLLLPCAPVVLNVADAFVNGALLIALLAWYHIMPSFHILFAPVSFLPVIMISLGVGMLASTWMVIYHDIKNVIPIALQFGLLSSPVAFTLSAAPPEWATWMWLNPLAMPIECFRWSIIPGASLPSLMHMLIGIAEAFGLFFVGYAYFRHHEGRLADVI